MAVVARLYSSHPTMSDPVLGLQSYIREGKSLLLQMLRSKDKPPELRKLLKHVRHRRIKFVQRGGYKTFIMDDNIIMDGLTKCLMGSFWKSSTAPKVTQGDTKTKVTVNTGGCYYGGISRKHGQRAHADFAKIVKCMTSQTTIRKGGSYTISKVDACAFRMFMTLIRKKIVPVICEMAVYDEYLRIATAVDCIAYDLRSHRVIAIEIKTGHTTQRNYSMHKKGKTLLSPLHMAPDSPLNRAWIQLLTTLLIVKRRYGINIHDGLVVRPLGQTGRVQTYKIPEWMEIYGYQHIIYTTLKSRLRGSRESRSFNVPATAKVRSKFHQDREKQRARERMSDPCPDQYWERILPVEKSIPICDPIPDTVPISDYNQEPTDANTRDIDEDCPPPYMVHVEQIGQSEVIVIDPDTPSPVYEQTPESDPDPESDPEVQIVQPELSWGMIFGRQTSSTSAPKTTANTAKEVEAPLGSGSLTWDLIERQLRASMRHG